MIRAGTNCFTIALCAEMGHEDAMVSLRDVHADEIRKFKDVLVEVRKELGIEWEPKPPPENPSLPKEEWVKVSPLDFGEYAYLLVPRRGEVIEESE